MVFVFCMSFLCSCSMYCFFRPGIRSGFYMTTTSSAATPSPLLFIAELSSYAYDAAEASTLSCFFITTCGCAEAVTRRMQSCSAFSCM